MRTELELILNVFGQLDFSHPLGDFGPNSSD